MEKETAQEKHASQQEEQAQPVEYANQAEKATPQDNTDSKETQETKEGGTGRIEAFSDGVFAIAITLLVLDLKVPDLNVVNPTSLAEALSKQWSNYLILVISFATILIMWVYHHRLFQTVKKAETALLFTNGFLLLLVTIVPFPTALVGRYLTTSAASVACAVYAGFFVLIDTAYSLLWWVVARQQPGYGTRRKRVPMSMLISFLGIPCYLIATLVAFWNPYFTIGICCALWIVWAFTAPTQSIKQEDSF